ncbi:hypothetical protein HYR69_08395, partial [Candidatus Sumerlaeota bacterium]|nr:hypothetical protein [Candidatus Sumerlaeota bacterium]
EAVSHDFAGIDVHPLAVLMAKANLLLALGEDARGHKTQVRLPIFMADTLQTEVDDKKGYLSIPAAKGCVFYLPLASIENHADQLDRMIEEMHEFARAIAEDGVAVEAARKGFVKKFPFLENGSNREWFFWKQNIETAAKLIKMKRNSVWAFILKNTYRPTFLRKRRVDYIVGNPPWLSYRYIKDEQYKKRIKELASDLALFGKKSSHLITQLDLSTIFYRHCEATFLAEGGKMGFVLPRSVIIGAKQHEGFQKQNQFSLVIDCERVENLFNVPTCVLFRLGGTCGGDQIPSLVLEGRVTPRNAALEIAKQLLHMSEGEHTLVSHEAKSPWYRKMAFQGATIVPRSLYFVERDEDCADVKDAPYLQSSQEAIREAKYQWRHKSVQVSGQVESDYLYYTILAKDLLPFCVRSADPIFLPIKANRQGRLEFYNTNRMIESGQTKAMKWLAYVERTWNHFRKSEQYDACGRLNYNGLLLCQDPKAKYAVIYNGSGTNLTSAVHSYGHFKTLDGIPVQGFIADAKTYYLYLNSEQHADYLCAALNAEPVMEAIKETMPRGLMGERDIHRRPFEACHIPQFDPSVGLHQQIAALGMVCRKKAEKVAEKMEGPIGRARLEMRAYLEDELKQLDPLVAELIQYKGAAKPKPKKRSSKPGELMLLF